MHGCDECADALFDAETRLSQALADIAALTDWRYAGWAAFRTSRALLPIKEAEDWHGGLAEPWPGLSGAQRAAMVALTAGPRLTPEVADTCGWSRATAGSVLSALRRRGLAVEVGGLWSRA